MDTLRQVVKTLRLHAAARFSGVFGITNALKKEPEILKGVCFATLLSLLVQGLTLMAYYEVKEDLTLRIWMSSHDMKKKCGIGFLILCCLWLHLVKQRRQHKHILSTHACLTFPSFFFLGVVLFGAYTGAGLHIYPELGLPRPFELDMEHLLVF